MGFNIVCVSLSDKTRKSEDNANADMLSRLPTDSNLKLAQENEINHSTVLEEIPINVDDIADETQKDRTLARIYHYIMNG